MDSALAGALCKYLAKHDYINDDFTISEAYKADREAGTIAEPTSDLLIAPFDGLLKLVDALNLNIPVPVDGRKPKHIPLNEKNFSKKEFQQLWGRINHKAVYQVEFDSQELIGKCIFNLDKNLRVNATQYEVETGQQIATLEAENLASGHGFTSQKSTTHTEPVTAGSTVKYDLIGEITEKTQLTRKTAANILAGISPFTFAMYRLNPEHFIIETARHINEQKAAVIVEHLTYDTLAEEFDSAIFTDNQTKQELTKAAGPLNKSIYNYVVTDSNVERDFVEQLDVSSEVAVYAKLPRGFFIPTPVGDYNPDWAIAFTEGTIKHVYFVAETKGSMSSLQLKGAELAKIECAKKFFNKLSQQENHEIDYNVITSYADLMQLVSK